jgi:hypothetical protein
MKKLAIRGLIAAGLIAFLASCGIDDYFYLNAVPLGNIQSSTNSMVSINLPNIDLQQFYYFTNFTIYYRIYISDFQELSTLQLSQAILTMINPTLSSDYFAILPYTTSNTENTQVSTSISTLFRNYHVLGLEDISIEDVLDTSARGRSITLDFLQIPGSIPYLRIGNTQYNLFRSNGNGIFNPLPDRYFVNSSQLHSGENAISTINADVVNNNVSGSRYTYASMYIVVTGIDNNFSPVYSVPTFIGIFLLPDPS